MTKSFFDMLICNYFIYTVFMHPLSTCTLDTHFTQLCGFGLHFPLESSTTSILVNDPGVIAGSNNESGSTVSAIVEGPDMAEEMLVQGRSVAVAL